MLKTISGAWSDFLDECFWVVIAGVFMILWLVCVAWFGVFWHWGVINILLLLPIGVLWGGISNWRMGKEDARKHLGPSRSPKFSQPPKPKLPPKEICHSTGGRLK